MQGRHQKRWRFFERVWTTTFVALFVFQLFAPGLVRFGIPTALAAQSTIDATVDINGSAHLIAGSRTVFVDDDTGYRFYQDSTGVCQYAKTTNGGSSWNTPVTVDERLDCIAISVWYDRWTPGDTGTNIHIVTMDTVADDLFYNELDTTTDTLLRGSIPVSAVTNSGNSIATFTEGSNIPTITKGTDGTIYLASSDVSDSYIVECTTSCNLAASWTETGTNPLDLADDYNMLVPLSGGNIMIINRDLDAEDIRSRIWNNSNWGGGWTTIDGNAPDNVTYDVGMAVTVSQNTGNLYLAYIAQNVALGADDQIRTVRYSGGVWSTRKEAVRYTELGLTSLSIALDSSNDDVYIAYSGRPNPAAIGANVYWKKSLDSMASWADPIGPVNTSADDLYGVDLNLSSDERLYVSWFDNTDDDIYGDTIADVYSGLSVAATTLYEPIDADSYTQINVDTAVDVNGTSHTSAGKRTVFIDQNTGYRFYQDSTGPCVYSKTTDGGASWGTAVTVDAQTDCIAIQVWYDRWTPGDTGTNIHIATLDIGNDDVWYNRLDTTTDTRLLGTTPVSTLTNTGQGGNSITEGENFIAITKGTDGTVYVVSNDGTGTNDSFVLECTTNCNLATGWTETGTNPLDVASDFNILLPLSGGNIMLLNRDISADTVRFRTWNNTNWGAGWTPIDTSAPENATYDVNMAVDVDPDTGNLYMAYIARSATLGTDDVVRTARYSGGSWASTTPAVASTVTGLTDVDITYDTGRDTAYVAYSTRATPLTANTGNVLWKASTDAMNSWSLERGPVNTTSDDINGVSIDMLGADKVYATWFDTTDDDIYGALVTTYTPAPPTTGSQIATTSASTSDVYIGGTFTITNRNDSGSLSVTGITITESGTIDGFTDIANIRLYYESDTSSPYTCASDSYNGSENQFGSTDVNGFSGANGVSSFTGSSVSVSSTSALCVYAVMDVLTSADADSTIDISIQNPSTDITVSGGVAGPSAVQNIPGTTDIENAAPTQTHFHWRNDDGNETTATSATGGNEDAVFTALQKNDPVRLRIQVSNEGNSNTASIPYRLEYASNPSTCAVATGWTDVGSVGGEFDMSDSTFFVDGAHTTDIGVLSGGVTNENTTFLSPNAALKDTSSQTAGITLTPSQFVEIEYAIIATTASIEGNSYCFRVTNAGIELPAYSVYPRANINADIFVSPATSSMSATTTSPDTDFYVGSSFVIAENTSMRDVTSITLTHTGTANGATGLDTIRLYYDLDSTLPYDCSSESYGGSETQFGSTDTDGFSAPNGSSTFTGAVTLSTTSTMCLYVVLDVTDRTRNGETVSLSINNPSVDVTASSGSVGPSIPRSLNGSTTLIGAILTQTHYHWRNDNGSETTATSLTNGNEDTPISNIGLTTPVRLRMQISNEGTIASPPYAIRLEYGPKVSTCAAVATWTDVGDSGGAWDMYDSPNITEGSDTTDVAEANGGVSNENVTFVTPNSALKDTSSTLSGVTLTAAEYLETEFAIIQTAEAGNDVPYCFRLSSDAVQLNVYSQYPELRTAPERDFEIQRGTFTMTGTSQTLTAGVDYVAPAASTSAFIRITNTHHTGAGSTATGNQNANNVSVYILNPSNLTSSVTFTRIGATGNTRVSWEIVEFIGEPGSDNEIIVRAQQAVTYGAASLTATGTAVSGVASNNDVAVFITGVANPDIAATNYNSMQSTAVWNTGLQAPVFTRGTTGSDAVRLSYAVVEFTGANWYVQRVQNTYTNSGTTEAVDITPVNSRSRTFLHTQQRMDTPLTGVDEFGAEVWLSSISQVSFFLTLNATSPSGITSVAWVIENIQTTQGAMEVTRSEGSQNGGAEPVTLSISIGKTLSDITNASIFANSRGALNGTTYPHPIFGATIASTTHYQLWRSDTTGGASYRTEIVEWPTAGLAVRQNYYRVYADNSLLDPSDPWPPGPTDLGENTALTGSDEPLGESDRVRLRMSVRALNATFPAGSKAFKLQYGEMLTSCSAIPPTSWSDLGDSASSTIWRGYNVIGLADGSQLSGDPPTGGDLNLSVSDVAGSYEEGNPSIANPYAVAEGDDIEYDWVIEQNGASGETFYCFRMVESDGTALGGYTHYPQIRTASFTPRSQNWRWYNDETSVTPSVAFAAENVAPVNIANAEILKLRIAVAEIENISREDVRFRLQFSEYADFREVFNAVATSTCTATSTWCYAMAAGADNTRIQNAVLTDSESCVSQVGNGCGTHNESPLWFENGIRHESNAVAEYEFVVQSAGPRVNRVYYFRLYDVIQDIPVPVNTGETYPSLVTEGASLTFDMEGVASGEVVEGVTVDISTTPSSLTFGALVASTSVEGAHRLTVDANGTEGYTILMAMDGDLMNAGGAVILPVTGTNASPSAWNIGCLSSAPSCFGFHTSDDTLANGSTRFAALDTYARVSTTTAEEVAYSSQPVAGETTDIVFRIFRREFQASGDYEARIQYISVPEF